MNAMKTGWLLYDAQDYEVNRSFASHIQHCGKQHGIMLQVVITDNFEEALQNPPDFVISRQRNYTRSAHLETMGIPVFNNSRVCEICNDKRKTHQFLQGFPQMRTAFVTDSETYTSGMHFPLVVKPAFGHGGEHVTLVNHQAEYSRALSAIFPNPALVQETASEAGCDLRIYVLFGEIVAGVMRTAREGIVSNYKQGGRVALHTLTASEQMLAERVIQHFRDIGAPLSLAGIDLIYHNGEPVINEVEDVVGSRMLYQVSDIDIIAMYIEGIAHQLAYDRNEIL